MKILGNVKFATPPPLKLIVKFINNIKYKLIRPIISSFLYYLKHKKNFKHIHVGFDGQELKKGITVYIPCKNEEAHLMMCLNSLLGVVDQFILIDNGSEDETLKIMNSFKNKHKSVSIEVYSFPKMLLVDMVQFALSRVNYSWVLKWDGDMLLINNDNQFSRLKEKCMMTKRPTAYTLPRINLSGDYVHVGSWTKVVDKGEPFLRTFNNQFKFTEEYGRLEHAIIPIYYKLVLKNEYYSFHFSNLRPPLRIMYRHCYLDWRETINTSTQEVKNKYKEIDEYMADWFLHNFGTNDSKSLKFRSGRLIASMCERFSVDKYCKLPHIIEEQIELKKERFVIKYKDNKPYLMVDNQDVEMDGYKPLPEDLNWRPNYNFFFNDALRMNF